MGKKTKDEHKKVLLRDAKIFRFDELTSDQQKAVTIINDWYHSKKHSKKDMVLRIGGCAGTGKTSILTYLLKQFNFDDNECYVVAYTGQAVNVLRQKGIMAKTIHSTFMHATEEPLLDENGNVITRSGVPIMKTRFRPVKKIPSTVKLIICDEASFLPEKLEELMLRYNVLLLEFGDPIQLPPVSGKQCFHMDNLDYFMTQIMRQEGGSEIVDLATKVRHYDPIDISQYHNEVQFLWAQPTIEETFFRFKPFIRGADVTIVSTNKQRDFINRMYREHILHTESPFPIKGERMICRKNDWNLMLGPFPLTNGTQGIAMYDVGRSEVERSTGIYTMDFKPDFIQNDYFDGLSCDIKFLLDDNKNKKDMSFYEQLNPGKKFEYAHAITCHLSQGAEYQSVVFLDSFNRDAEYHMRVRYTAITRAVGKLWYVLPYSKNCPHWTDLSFGGFRE